MGLSSAETEIKTKIGEHATLLGRKRNKKQKKQYFQHQHLFSPLTSSVTSVNNCTTSSPY